MTGLIPFLGTLALAAAPPQLEGLRVSNGGPPFAGDGPLLATVSPNGDGFRDEARVRFRLDRRATVRMEAVRTDTIQAGRSPVQTVWSALPGARPLPSCACNRSTRASPPARMRRARRRSFAWPPTRRRYAFRCSPTGISSARPNAT